MAVTIEAVQPVLAARDVRAAIAFYARLGFVEVFVDDPAAPRYAGVRRDGLELHLQWHEAAHWDGVGDRPAYRFVVSDVDALSDELADPTLDRTPVRDTPWGTRELHVRDPSGNCLQFYRPLASGGSSP